jgi:predicted HTH domain antitoxin
VNALTFKVTTVRLPEETLEALEDLTNRLQRERSDVMREAMKIGIGEMTLRLALELYIKGKISFGRMSELTGLGYRELSLSLKRRNITLRYGEERLNEEVEQPGG